MEFSKKNIDDLNAVLTIQVTPEDYSETVEKTLTDYRKTANIPGFRPGKVPAGLIKKQYRMPVMIDEINKLLQDGVYKYIADENIDILGNPLPIANDSIDWNTQDTFEFQFELGIAPTFEVKITAKNKITYNKVIADKAVVDKFVEDMSKRYGKMSSPETFDAADMFEGSFVELRDGEVLEGGLEKTTQFAGSSLKGKSKKALLEGALNDVITIDAKKDFAKGFNAAGLLGITDSALETMDGKFQFTLTNVTRIEPAEMNQEFFDKIYGEGTVSSEKEFRARVKEEAEKMYKADADQYFMNSVADYLLEKTKFDLPDTFLKKWMTTNGENPISAEEIETEYPKMVKGLKWQLIENRIIRDQSLTVTQDEMLDHTKNMVNAQLAQYGQSGMEDEEVTKIAMNVLKNQEEVQRLNEQLYGAKMLDYYLNTFKIQEEEVSYDEFVKLASEQKG